jgi:hypothetical protein
MYHWSAIRCVRSRAANTHSVPKGTRVRRLHKAFLRYHDPNNWPILREALKRMGRADLIGLGKHQLVPPWQPAGTEAAHESRHRAPAVRSSAKPFRTQHTGLPDASKASRRTARAPDRPAASKARAGRPASRRPSK